MSAIFMVAVSVILFGTVFVLYDKGFLSRLNTQSCPQPNCGGIAKDTGWTFGFGEAPIYECQECKMQTTFANEHLQLPVFAERLIKQPLFEHPLYRILHPSPTSV
jgi:hypothetical protein